jgi:MFS family permease
MTQATKREIISKLRVLVSIIMLVALLSCFFTPVFTFDASSVTDGVEEFVAFIDMDDEIKKAPDTYEFSLTDFILMLFEAPNTFSLYSDYCAVNDYFFALPTVPSDKAPAMPEITPEDERDLSSFENEEKRDYCLFIISVAESVLPTPADAESYNDYGSAVSILLQSTPLIQFLFAVILLVLALLALPIYSIVVLIRALVNVAHLRKTEYPIVYSVMSAATYALALPLMQLMFPQFGAAAGWKIMYAGYAACIILLALLAWLTPTSPEKKKYRLVAQLTSLVSVAGSLIVLFAVLKLGYPALIREPLLAFVEASESAVNSFIAIFVVYVAGLVVGLLGINYFPLLISRIACGVNDRKAKIPTFIPTAIAGLIFACIPMLLSREDFTSSLSVPFIDLGDGKTYAYMLIAGMLVFIIGEILMLVLGKKLCPQLEPLECLEILTCTAPTPDEELEKANRIVESAQQAAETAAAVASTVAAATAAAVVAAKVASEATAPATPVLEVPFEEVPAEEPSVEEAPAEEAPAEEAPAEEAPAEEATAEEATAEEAPAEEAPAEEAPAEEAPVEEATAKEAPETVE